MNKIDWTKPIETLNGHSATLLHVLENDYVVCKHSVIYMNDNKEYLLQCNEFGQIVDGGPNDNRRRLTLFIRNVAPPLVLYGRLEPLWPNDIEGTGWTHLQGRTDTHVMTLTPDDIKRLVKPIKPIKPKQHNPA